MTYTYWHGLLTLPALAIAGALLYGLVIAAMHAWHAFANGPGFALNLLSRARQRKAVAFWESPPRLKISGRELPPNAYERRKHIYAFEQMLNGTYTGPHGLMNRLMQRNYYPVFAEAVPRLAEQCREWERRKKAEQAEYKRKSEAEQAKRKASDEAARTQITALLGDDYGTASWIQLGRPHPLKPDLDEVLFIPGTKTFEPVPGNEGMLLKWPDLAVRVSTTGLPKIEAYCPADFARPHDAGTNLLGRLQATHPHVFAEEQQRE